MEYSDVQLAWLAGLLEGEGSFIPATEKNPVCIAINMTDKDIIDKVAQWWGVSVCLPRKQEDHHKQSYRCMIRGSRAVTWMESIYGWMGERRKSQINTAIDSHKPKGPFQKINHEEALEIKQRFLEGESAVDLATEFEVSKWTVYAIHQGRRSTGL